MASLDLSWTGRRSWSLPLFWVLLNAVIAYGPLAFPWKAWVLALGLVLPFAVFLARTPLEKGDYRALTQGELLPEAPSWVLVLLFLGAVGIRFFRLTSLSLWPLEDEAMDGHYALELLEQGHWQMTYDFSGLPPFYVWMLAGSFKYFGVSLATLWALPAFLSSLGVLSAYAAARRLFSRSFALIFGLWMGYCFWPLYLARFSVEGGFLMVWECVTFYVLSIYWTGKDGPGASRKAWALGTCSGLGFFTFQSWPVLAFLLTLLLAEDLLLGSPRRWGIFWRFFIPQTALFLVLACAALPDRGGHYAYVLQDPFGGAWLGLNDLFSFFWGSRLTPNLFAYRPFWGGFLNPVLGGLFFWGVLRFLKCRPAWTGVRWAGAFFILILPGFITGGLDAHRVVQTAPFLLLGCAFGAAALLSQVAPGKRWQVLALVFILSLGLDVRHLFGAYHAVWAHPKDNWFASKSLERMRAFSIVKDLADRKGPGYLLTHLSPNMLDQSLAVLSRPFNAAENPDLRTATPSWAALLVNVHYGKELGRLFPDGKWIPLGLDVERPDGGLMLGILPWPSKDPRTLERWVLADRALEGIVDIAYDNHDWKPRDPVVQALTGLYPAYFKGDRLLESCFWEMIADQDYADRLYEDQRKALGSALALGFPAAHLYNDLGALALRRRHWDEAEWGFRKAVQCVPDLTSAKEGLKVLEQMRRTGVPPEGVP